MLCCAVTGFEDSRTLARKMVKLYKLASEQLSQQDHYDFGMRAVKSVLLMAGSLRRSQPGLAEDVMLIRAMRDSNLPKFLSSDIELFQNIISDLFPGVDVPVQVCKSVLFAIHTGLRTIFCMHASAVWWLCLRPSHVVAVVGVPQYGMQVAPQPTLGAMPAIFPESATLNVCTDE